MGLGQTLHLAEARVESHRGVGGVFGHVEVSGATQLLLNHQGLLQQLGGEEKEKKKSTSAQQFSPVFPQILSYNLGKSHHFE